MKILKEIFVRLFWIIEVLFYYFVGLNVDLLIVGGLIFFYDYYQVGCYEFFMVKVLIEKFIKLVDYL